jgi:RimJ/RimL family protein N-acetyltransferase
MSNENLRSVSVNKNNEAKFYSYIKDNFSEFFFFHVDYAQYPEDTDVYMAIDEKEDIHGLLLIWKGRRFQLRGSADNIELLLNNKKINPISITGFEAHKKLIAKYFPDYTKETAMYRMEMDREDHKDYEKYPFEVLLDSHKEEIAHFMNVTDPVYWGSRQPEDITIDENNIIYGIFENNRLISFTSFWKYEKVGYITIVGTHPDYWNKGYASSLVSSALKYLFQEREKCFITVRVKNPPAIHVYEKLGFRIQNTQYQFEKENI